MAKPTPDERCRKAIVEDTGAKPRTRIRLIKSNHVCMKM